MNNPITQTNSDTVEAMLLYSDSAELFDTMFCFFNFQEMSESSCFTMNHMTDFSGVWTWCPVCITICSNFVAFPTNHQNSHSWLPFMHLTILSAASQWDLLGCYINWLSVCTSKAISSLISVKYSSLPISLWYCSLSPNSSSVFSPAISSHCLLVNFGLMSRGMLTALEALNPTYEMSSKDYFHQNSSLWSTEFNPQEIF